MACTFFEIMCAFMCVFVWSIEIAIFGALDLWISWMRVNSQWQNVWEKETRGTESCSQKEERKKTILISNNWYAGKWNAHHISFYSHFTSHTHAAKTAAHPQLIWTSTPYVHMEIFNASNKHMRIYLRTEAAALFAIQLIWHIANTNNYTQRWICFFLFCTRFAHFLNWNFVWRTFLFELIFFRISKMGFLDCILNLSKFCNKMVYFARYSLVLYTRLYTDLLFYLNCN